MAYYVNAHQSQYQSGSSATTRSSGCTWTSAANGIDASTGGRVVMTPDQVHNLLDPNDETNPGTPGWSLPDLDRAMNEIAIPFSVRSGSGWAAVEQAHDAGQYVVLQGDSDIFGSSTCSGAFDGDHCIGIHPDEDPDGRWRIDDPICAKYRYEASSRLRQYAEKLYAYIYFGVFVDNVPRGGVKVGRNFSIDMLSAPVLARFRAEDGTYGYLELVNGKAGTAEGIRPVQAGFGERYALRAYLEDGTIDGKPGGDERRDGYIMAGDLGTFGLATDLEVTPMETGIFRPAGQLYIKTN